MSFPDNGVFPVGLQVTDDDGASDIASSNVTVLNVAPVADAGPDGAIILGDAFNGNFNFSDPGLNDSPWSYTVDWDDGSAITNGVALTQAAAISESHLYGTSGDYTVRVCVTDKDDGTGCDTLDVTVVSAQSLNAQSLKQGAADGLLPHVPPVPIVITALPGLNAIVDLEGRRYFISNQGIRGNASSSPVIIGDPVYTPEGSDDSEGSLWTFVDGQSHVGEGNIWIQTRTGHNWSIPLQGEAGVYHTVRMYMDIYHWSGNAEYVVSVGNDSKIITKSDRFGTLYQVDITFMGNTTLTVESEGNLSFSAFALAAVVVLDNGVTNPPDLTEAEGGLGLALNQIQASLHAEFWLDEMHLAPESGIEVFEFERAAVAGLTELLNDPAGLTTAGQGAATMAIDDLVTADRMLANTAINDVLAGPPVGPELQGAIDELLALAALALSEGDTAAGNGNAAGAIMDYAIAWQNASDAMAIQINEAIVPL